MPARTAFAPRRGARRLARLRRFPEGKIHCILLQVADVDPGAGFQVIQRLMRKFSVFVKMIGAEIYIPVFRPDMQSLYRSGRK